MIKKYDIISLNNHLYMVDKEITEKGQWYFNSEMQLHKAVQAHVSSEAEVVLASTDTTLTLPLLPKIEEDIPRLDTTDEDQQWAFQQGYKAASVKKYTEENMRKAIEFGRDIRNEKSDIPSFLQSLTSKPKQIEVELEPYNIIDGKKQYCAEGYDDLSSMPDLKYEPKTKDNIVIIRRWIYE